MLLNFNRKNDYQKSFEIFLEYFLDPKILGKKSFEFTRNKLKVH